MRPDPEEEWARWVDWLGEGPAPSIWDDVVAMMASRQVWEAFQIVYKSAPEVVRTRRNPTFYSWITDGYTRRQGLAIRRQVDMDRDVISLAGLIDRVRRHPDVLSCERFAARSVLERPEADRVFDAIVGEGRDHIDPNVPRADLATLRTTTRKVVTWVDNEVAHYNEAKGRFAQGLTFGDIHGSVDLMVDLSSKSRS
jgi:hypothetical protein